MTQSEQGNAVSEQLWQFVQNTYALAGVAENCLNLQDTYDVDVSLLLYLVWCAAEGRALTPEQIATLDKHCQTWREAVIKPLRKQRRQWRTAPSAWYEAAKSLELEAERLLLSELATQADVGAVLTPGDSALRVNFAALSRFMDTGPGGDLSGLEHALAELEALLLSAQSDL